jgi:hypothetical protein
MGPDRSIDWVRWIFYLLAGIPLVALIFFARDRVIRLAGVLGVTLFIQDSFAGRRYFWAFSLGPSLIVAYIGLLSQVLEQRRLPRLGVYGPLWLALLFAGIVSIVAGSIDSGMLQLHVKQFQFCYLEGLVFFLYGTVALRKSEEFRAFFHWTVAFGVAMALQHFFVAATGFKFRGSASVHTDLFYYAGVLDNGNNLGSYWSVTIPVTLAIALAPDTSRRLRLACFLALVPMLGSLLLSGSRGGLVFTLFNGGLLAVTSGVRVRRFAVAAVLAGLVAALGYLVISTFVATTARDVFEQLRKEGGETTRWVNFAAYAQVMLDHPFGNGMAPEAMARAATRHGVATSSAHNIYLDLGTQAGFAGLGIFLAMAASLLVRNRRAFRLASDAATREGLSYLFLSLAGFLAVGFFEPILASSNKLNNYFFLLAGLSVAAASRVFDSRRIASESESLAGARAADLPAHAPTA